jgi:hypothetical protein
MAWRKYRSRRDSSRNPERLMATMITARWLKVSRARMLVLTGVEGLEDIGLAPYVTSL